jgi:prepilin peptidase CpaA
MIGQPYFLIAAVIVAAVAAWFDSRSGEMPDAVTLVPLAAAPVAHGIVAAVGSGGGLDAAVQAAGFSVLGAAVTVLVPAALFRAGAIGGGDVKLFAALGALLNTLLGVEAEFYACLAASLISLGVMAYHGKLLRVLANTFALAFNPLLPKEKRRDVPQEQLTWARFGPAIFIGTALTAVLHWRQP